MSLRGFHIVFISLTTLLSVFMLAWAFWLAPSDAGTTATVVGGLGVAGMLVFPAYGVYFYRKARKLII